MDRGAFPATGAPGGTMTLGTGLNLLHVLTAFWLVSGMVGRGVALQEAARAADVRAVEALVRLAGRFERMVRVPSIAVLVFGLLTAWRQGWPILGFLEGGRINWVLASLVLYLSLVPLVVLVLLPRGRVFERALRDALTQGRVTPALTAAFRDRAVSAARAWELLVVALLVWLMVAKPF